MPILNYDLDWQKEGSEHFRRNYIDGDDCYQRKRRFEFGIGEVSSEISRSFVRSALQEFSQDSTTLDLCTKYNGSSRVRQETRYFQEEVENYLGHQESGAYNISFFDGCHEALTFAILYFKSLNNKEYCIFPAPSYPYWLNASSAGQKSRLIHCAELNNIEGVVLASDFKNVSCMVLNLPYGITRFKDLEGSISKINEIAERYDIGIIVDLTYRAFGPQGIGRCLGQFDPDRTIFVDSFSKSLGLPGLRLGYAYSQKPDVSVHLRSKKSKSSLLPSALKVRIAARCMGTGVSEELSKAVEMRQKYALSTIPKRNMKNVQLVDSEANGVFLIVRLRGEFWDSCNSLVSFQKHLKQRASIAAVIDDDINPIPYRLRTDAGHYLRISLGCEERLDQGLRGLLEAISEYPKLGKIDQRK